MADKQIMARERVSTPAAYVLQPAVHFTLKAVYADMLDNGATVDWLPCVTIYSDSGDVIAQAVDQGVKVTAGDDAEVSWFPGVKHATPAATPSTGGAREMLMMIQPFPAQSIPNNAGTLVEFGTTSGTNFYTNAPADWTFDVAASGNYNGVHIEKPGTYLVIGQFSFTAPGNYNKQMQVLASSAETNPIGNAGGGDRTFDTFADTLQTSSIFVLSSASAPGSNTVQMSALQVSGAPVNVGVAALTIMRLGSVFP